ncbi:unnamed protein product [Linum tenue]|uniref:Uncharacterized protein n=1 Tax=Linum tenue TaxID=586396 RepID=A0AAV0QRT5_9ROSI|nr:unnamed protein product [Linum tenue]
MSSTPDKRRSSAGTGSSKRPLTLAILMSVSSLMALCAKHAGKFTTKLTKNTTTKIPSRRRRPPHGLSSDLNDGVHPPRSPLVRHSKQLLTQISNRAITLVHGNRNNKDRRGDIIAPDEFGDGGVWQRSILMGDKCQPLDFSGVIYYDSCGKQVNEVAIRSPRASPLPGYLTRGQ